MEGLLDTLVPGAVSCGENVGAERGRRWNEDAPAMEDEPIHQRPVRRRLDALDFLPGCDDLRKQSCLAPEFIEELERWG
jgi:hypothetical protein